MNFFGHAVAASWERAHPRFTLGAMLPDFASMLGARVEAVEDREVAAGIAWHHRTDAVFHRLAAFRRWSMSLTRRLAEAGASRGSSLAAGHVGVELVLDGVLVDREPDLEDEYTAALAAVSAVARSIRWRPAAAPPIEHLAERLGSRGLPVGYRDDAIVADRVIRVLARRPRLAMAPERAPVLARELGAMRAEIEAGASDLIAALRSALSDR